MTIKGLKMFEDFLQKLHERLCKACTNNDLDTVKYLLENEKIKKNIDLTTNGAEVLFKACEAESEETLDYLLTYDEFNTEDCLKHYINKCFITACGSDAPQVARFIFENEKYGKHIDFDFSEGLFFKNAYAKNKLQVAEFLIMETPLSRENQFIKQILKTVPSQIKKQCEILFSAKELAIELNVDSEGKNATKRLKI